MSKDTCLDSNCLASDGVKIRRKQLEGMGREEQEQRKGFSDLRGEGTSVGDGAVKLGSLRFEKSSQHLLCV